LNSYPNLSANANPKNRPEGLLLLDKPAGLTSFDCVRHVKRTLGGVRVGHCGTLDPLAEGLLLILAGPATRRQESFLALPKTYWFCAELGRRTSTGDREGEILEQKPWDGVTQERLEEVIQRFIGTTPQLPPRYAALKYKGKPYYEYARKGIEVPRVPRLVTIHSFSLLSFRPPLWEARVVCARGAYVRVLVEDVAAALGTCGVLVKLIRERIGPYIREDALSWEKLTQSSREELATLLQRLQS
jgi:tRNA pseudouridine55 synthase